MESTTRLTPASEDLVARQPVWEALSDLFLDTDTSLSRPWRVEQLAGSTYSIGQLDHILLDEVYPVCRFNLMSVAGEWAGFDQAWLQTRILRRLASPLRFLHRFSPGRMAILRCPEWRATRQAIVALRAAQVVKERQQGPG
jgi:hypothetical protein